MLERIFFVIIINVLKVRRAFGGGGIPSTTAKNNPSGATQEGVELNY